MAEGTRAGTTGNTDVRGGHPGATADASYGSRFLRRMDLLSGRKGSFPYAIRKGLQGADQEQMIALLRREFSISFTYHHAMMIREHDDPEELASLLFTQRQAAANQMMWAFMIMMT